MSGESFRGSVSLILHIEAPGDPVAPSRMPSEAQGLAGPGGAVSAHLQTWEGQGQPGARSLVPQTTSPGGRFQIRLWPSVWFCPRWNHREGEQEALGERRGLHAGSTAPRQQSPSPSGKAGAQVEARGGGASALQRLDLSR